MAQRQLNIRSDEAAERAARLARQTGKTTTEVVILALRAYSAAIAVRDELDLTPSQRADYDALLSLARETAGSAPPGLTSDHGWLYDENGLPK